MRERYGQALRLASTLELSRQQWLAIRGLGIGSSDAASAVGLSPYKSALTLWLEKTGRREPEDLSGKQAVLWGTVLEPVLANVYAEQTGRRVRRVSLPRNRYFNRQYFEPLGMTSRISPKLSASLAGLPSSRGLAFLAAESVSGMVYPL